LTAYLNGTIVSGLTTTDSAISSGRVGLTYSSENAGKSGTWDNWEGGDYGAAGPQDTPELYLKSERQMHQLLAT
jgi:hypothetical protein